MDKSDDTFASHRYGSAQQRQSQQHRPLSSYQQIFDTGLVPHAHGTIQPLPAHDDSSVASL